MLIITTGDGSHTLVAPFPGEHYHSLHGAVNESLHVYIENGIAALTGRHEISILEVGFGTGLNALLSFYYARSHDLPIRYVTLENYPLDINIASKLNYGYLIGNGGSDFIRLHKLPWNFENKIEDLFVLEKIETAVENAQYDSQFDIVFFDAFGPSYQPELWVQTIFKKMYESLKPGGILVTFCAKGQVKRDMASVGFRIDAIPGPPGKREMIRAYKDVEVCAI